jgi:hypothetical protein
MPDIDRSRFAGHDLDFIGSHLPCLRGAEGS